MPWRRRFAPIVMPVMRRVWRVTRGMTLGVRGLVTDADGRVLLIEHTYVAGWYLPGGGVERGETVEASLARELVEEAGVEPTGPMRLASIHDNRRRYRGDHVLLYRVDAWRPVEATSRGEIHARGWFAPDALPDGVTAGTRARIEEMLTGKPPDPFW